MDRIHLIPLDTLIDSLPVSQLDVWHFWSMPEQLQVRCDVDQPNGIVVLTVQ
jgi:hypothetical protein